MSRLVWLTMNGKKAIVAIPLGGGREHYARHLTGMFKDIFDYLGIIGFEPIVVTSVNKRKEVLNHQDILKFA